MTLDKNRSIKSLRYNTGVGKSSHYNGASFWFNRYHPKNKNYSYLLDENGHVLWVVFDYDPYTVYDYFIDHERYGLRKRTANFTIDTFEKKLKDGSIQLIESSLTLEDPGHQIMKKYKENKFWRMHDLRYDSNVRKRR